MVKASMEGRPIWEEKGRLGNSTKVEISKLIRSEVLPLGVVTIN